MNETEIQKIQDRFDLLWKKTKEGKATAKEITEMVKIQLEYWERPEVKLNRPPETLLEAHGKLTNATWEFCKICKAFDISPKKALSMIITQFLCIVGYDKETRRDLIVAATNMALDTTGAVLDAINE